MGLFKMEHLKQNQATVIHLINMYQKYECLWNYKNPTFERMDIKRKAWDKLARELECTVDEVKKKIRHLRTAYVAEKKKVEASRKGGSSVRIYEPRLFYFTNLSFLDDVIVLRKSLSNIEESDPPNEVEEPPAKRQKIVDKKKSPEKRKILEIKATPPQDDIIEETCEHPIANNNVADNLAKVWSAQYAELTSRQKVFARTIFSDVLFCGYLGRLTENTVENMHSVLRDNRPSSSPIETICTPLFEECAVSPASDTSEQFLTDDVKITRYSED